MIGVQYQQGVQDGKNECAAEIEELKEALQEMHDNAGKWPELLEKERLRADNAEVLATRTFQEVRFLQARLVAAVKPDKV